MLGCRQEGRSSVSRFVYRYRTCECHSRKGQIDGGAGLDILITHNRKIALSPDYGGYNPLTGGGYTDSEFEDELSRIRAVPGDKIHFFEISDVIKPEPPLLKGSSFDDYHKSDPEARVLFTWSICGRCLPLVGKNAGKDVKSELDLGGARAVEIMKAVLNTGFRGESPLSN
jgi:hypothetical protein